MSVNSYLTSLASALVLKDNEKATINTSISTLRSRLNAYFGNSVSTHFQFGSSTRGTILPRKADSNSDIDYMVVFDTSQQTLKPQTYLDKLRSFTEYYYSSSEIHQSRPTMVLKLNHIKFELVPAIRTYWSGLQIPSPAKSWAEWIQTDPTGFANKLTEANTRHNFQIKPLVRLVKYWNALNDYHFASFDLENYIVGSSYWSSTSLWDYFYAFWQGFSCSGDTAQYIKDKVKQAKERVDVMKRYEQLGYAATAEAELGKFLPNV